MILSIARQSVIIKCNMQKSILTGNYEFYYASGLLAKLSDVTVDDEIRPGELAELMKKETEFLKRKDEREAYLVDLIRGYKPEEVYDLQMKELLLMGKHENNLWNVTSPV